MKEIIYVCLFFSVAFTFIFFSILFLRSKNKIEKENARQAIQCKRVKIVSINKAFANLYSITAEFDTGERKLFDAKYEIAMLMVENDIGFLTYKGTEIIKFNTETSKEN